MKLKSFNNIFSISLLGMFLLLPLETHAITIADYLIDADIGEYSRSYPGSCPKGSGGLASAAHFKSDHADYACDIRYYNEILDNGVEIHVTQHEGTDSDKWLMHELDSDFRTYYGMPGEEYGPRQIDGQTILEAFAGGGNYRWLSGNKVIIIEYHDSQLTKPEPLEIVRAYLMKHPSTIAPITLAQLRNSHNKTTWIKDEMDRRLWLCDKWLTQLQLEKKPQRKVVEEVVKSMVIFLNYREKYFKSFGLLKIKADDEKMLLSNLVSQQSVTTIKEKLDEYKKWWGDNRDRSISL